MPSFDAVNYSLRPSKSIQRHIVFDPIKQLQASLDIDDPVYIGFGSVWFVDFVLAHKLLQINDMVSIEANDVGYVRATFNAPYATVRVMHGNSGDILPHLYEDVSISDRPWIIWLDYDYEFNETVSSDVRFLVENAPENSVLIITFSGVEMKYGAAPDRPGRLRELFGSSVPDDLSKSACKDDRLQETLADFALDFMRTIAADLSRPGAFLPAFRVIYKDTSPMVTVGGVLPAKGTARIAADVVNRHVWPARPPKRIVAPHLTIRESAILQSQLPMDGRLSRAVVNRLGFNLEDEQIETFQSYYKQYPAFAQILA